MSFSTVKRRTVDTVRAYFQGEWNGESWSFNELPPVALTFLQLVYMLLSFAFTTSAFGFYFRDAEIIGGSSAAIGSFATILSLCFVPRRFYEIRAFILITGSFFGGASLGPWVAWLVRIDSGYVMTALVGISLGFRCFWAASVWMRSLDLFCTSGTYLSIPILLLWGTLASIQFGGDSNLLSLVSAAVLALMGYVAIYSQVLVQKNREGDKDYVTNAIKLFTHLVPAFIRWGRLVYEAYRWNSRRRNRR
ncbi:hypothetical protein ACP275_02G153200 [Erythranthe tilingii]